MLQTFCFSRLLSIAEVTIEVLLLSLSCTLNFPMGASVALNPPYCAPRRTLEIVGGLADGGTQYLSNRYNPHLPWPHAAAPGVSG